MRIGDLARSTGTTPRTVRFYEERRLLPPADRSPSGQRLYGDEHVRRLRVVRELLALGLTVEDVALLSEDLHLLDVDTLPSDVVPEAARTAKAEALFARRLALLDGQIQRLTVLRGKVASCHAALVEAPVQRESRRG
jgi:MerR family copper efflux transcriptional regulator